MFFIQNEKISDLEEIHNFAHITYALFFSVCSMKHQQPLCASNIYQQSCNNSLINVSIFDIEGRYFFQNYWKVYSTCKRNETFVFYRNLWSIDIFISFLLLQKIIRLVHWRQTISGQVQNHSNSRA